MIFAVVTLLITTFAALVAARSLYLQNAQLKRDLSREIEYKHIAADHGYVVDCLLSIGRRWIAPGPGGPQGAAFDLAFPDRNLVRRIVTYLGTRNSSGDFIPYQLTADQLGNPECCRTIQEVLVAVEHARLQTWADKLSLPSKRN
jgi:hypothetical protein